MQRLDYTYYLTSRKHSVRELASGWNLIFESLIIRLNS